MTSDSVNQGLSAHSDDALDILIDSENMFSNSKDVFKKSIERRQRKLLKKIGFIKNFLKEDEKINLITTACSPTSWFEQYMIGWIFIYLKRSLLVFTNKRIIHIPTTKNYSYRNSISQILHSDCESIRIKGKNLFLKYKNETKEKFIYLSKKEKKKIKSMIPNILFDGTPSQFQKRHFLCPRCAEELMEGTYRCSNCRLEFKNKDDARKISILYPGGGYFYTRHLFLGIGDALTEAFLLVMVIASLVDVIRGGVGSIFALVFFAVVLIIEKLVTIYHSNHFIKEFIPIEKEVQTRLSQARG